MSERSEMYKRAIKKYQTSSNSYSFKEEIESICIFIVVKEWELYLELLEASGKEIQVGYLEGACSEIGYFLSMNGFFLRYNEGENVISKQLVVSSKDATEEVVLQIAKAFRNQHKDISFIDFIYEKLDEIAKACPK